MLPIFKILTVILSIYTFNYIGVLDLNVFFSNLDISSPTNYPILNNSLEHALFNNYITDEEYSSALDGNNDYIKKYSDRLQHIDIKIREDKRGGFGNNPFVNLGTIKSSIISGKQRRASLCMRLIWGGETASSWTPLRPWTPFSPW